MDTDGNGKAPANWREALLTLIASRVSLIQLESKDAAREAARRAAFTVALVAALFFTWALLLAGGIAALADATGWKWYWIALGASATHLIAAICLARAAKATGPPVFPVTRAEFQKDREWIENLQHNRKSNV